MQRHNDRRSFLATTAFGGMICGLGGLAQAGTNTGPSTAFTADADTPSADNLPPIASHDTPYYGAQTQRADRELPHFRPASAGGVDPRLGPGEMGRGHGQPRPGRAGPGPGNAGSRPPRSRGPAGRLPRGGRREVRRPVPRRRLSDRLGHLQQHERQRGDRQPGDRTRRRRPLPAADEADPPQRPRQPGPEHQRHVPHGDPRGRRPWRSSAS